MVTNQEYGEFHERLHGWYARHGRRDLPWRNTCDPYAIYISEIMLQQTQVKTVLERFYHPFLARFPTLQALADAPCDAVLKQWEGLGYYTRAGNLHAAAQQAAPHLPDTVEALEALPGIGRNTAHAVAAFAFNQPVPVMEANVKRVLSRLFALEYPPAARLWEKAWELLDTRRPFDYNQAMMDLGATVCLPRAPGCGRCPAQGICRGKAQPDAYPGVKAKKAIPIRKRRIVVWRDAAGNYHLTPRETAFLRGLYGFAEYPESMEVASLYNRAYLLAEAGEPLGQVTQIYSHFRLDANIWLVPTGETGQGEHWYSKEQIEGLALSGADRKIVALL